MKQEEKCREEGGNFLNRNFQMTVTMKVTVISFATRTYYTNQSFPTGGGPKMEVLARMLQNTRKGIVRSSFRWAKQDDATSIHTYKKNSLPAVCGWWRRRRRYCREANKLSSPGTKIRNKDSFNVDEEKNKKWNAWNVVERVFVFLLPASSG